MIVVFIIISPTILAPHHDRALTAHQAARTIVLVRWWRLAGWLCVVSQLPAAYRSRRSALAGWWLLRSYDAPSLPARH